MKKKIISITAAPIAYDGKTERMALFALMNDGTIYIAENSQRNRADYNDLVHAGLRFEKCKVEYRTAKFELSDVPE